MIRPKWLRNKPRKFTVRLTVDDNLSLYIWITDFKGVPYLNVKVNDLDIQDLIDNLREYDVRWDEN